MNRSLRSVVVRGACIVWWGFGLVLPCLMLLRHDAIEQPVLWAVIVAITTASAHIQWDFRIRGQSLTISPVNEPLVVAALFLPPSQAAMCAIVAMMLEVRSLVGGSPLWTFPANAGNYSMAVLVASLTSHALFGERPEPAMVVLSALLVAGLVATLTQVPMVAFMAVGEDEPPDIWDQVRYMVMIDVTMPTIVTVLAAPTIHVPAAVVLVFAAFQGFSYLALQLAGSEQVHRQKSEHLRDIFQRYVPASVADQLANDDQEIRLGGEQREISVLFCDIRGFTSWSENVEPELVIAQLNTLLGGLSGAVMDAGGTLDKYTGDGLMAFWGAPLDQPDHAELACAAAIDMLGRLEECNLDRARNGLPPFAIGIGVHSGPAVVGNVGHEDRLDYTAIGDTVNLSARLEAATKDVGTSLLLSGATRGRLSASHRELCTDIGSIRVKGRVQPVQVYTVFGRDLHEVMGMWNDSVGSTEVQHDLLEPASADDAEAPAGDTTPR